MIFFLSPLSFAKTIFLFLFAVFSLLLRSRISRFVLFPLTHAHHLRGTHTCVYIILVFFFSPPFSLSRLLYIRAVIALMATLYFQIAPRTTPTKCRERWAHVAVNLMKTTLGIIDLHRLSMANGTSRRLLTHETSFRHSNPMSHHNNRVNNELAKVSKACSHADSCQRCLIWSSWETIDLSESCAPSRSHSIIERCTCWINQTTQYTFSRSISSWFFRNWNSSCHCQFTPGWARTSRAASVNGRECSSLDSGIVRSIVERHKIAIQINRQARFPPKWNKVFSKHSARKNHSPAVMHMTQRNSANNQLRCYGRFPQTRPA